MQRRALISLLALAASGCAHVPQMSARVLSGRFSLQVKKNAQQEAWSGKYRLETQDEETVFSLMTPLNGILARVIVTRTRAVLERPQKEDITAADSSRLMQDAFGFSLPVEVLRAWLDGKAADGWESQTTDTGFLQLGWHITPQTRAQGRLVRATHPETMDFPSVYLVLTVDN